MQGGANQEIPDQVLETLHNHTANRIHENTDAWTGIVVNHAACLAAIESNKWDVAFTRLADYVLHVNHVRLTSFSDWRALKSQCPSMLGMTYTSRTPGHTIAMDVRLLRSLRLPKREW